MAFSSQFRSVAVLLWPARSHSVTAIKRETVYAPLLPRKALGIRPQIVNNICPSHPDKSVCPMPALTHLFFPVFRRGGHHVAESLINQCPPRKRLLPLPSEREKLSRNLKVFVMADPSSYGAVQSCLRNRAERVVVRSVRCASNDSSVRLLWRAWADHRDDPHRHRYSRSPKD